MVFQHKWHKLLQATWLRKRATVLAGGHFFLMPAQTPAVAIMDKCNKKKNKKNNYKVSFVHSRKLGQNSFGQTLWAGRLIEQPS